MLTNPARCRILCNNCLNALTTRDDENLLAGGMISSIDASMKGHCKLEKQIENNLSKLFSLKLIIIYLNMLNQHNKNY